MMTSEKWKVPPHYSFYNLCLSIPAGIRIMPMVWLEMFTSPEGVYHKREDFRETKFPLCRTILQISFPCSTHLISPFSSHLQSFNTTHTLKSLTAVYFRTNQRIFYSSSILFLLSDHRDFVGVSPVGCTRVLIKCFLLTKHCSDSHTPSPIICCA